MAEKTTATNAEKPKMVKIKLPLTKFEKDDEPVIINGYTYVIKRGETVEVPDYVVKVLENKEKMLALAYDFEEQASSKKDAKELK